MKRYLMEAIGTFFFAFAVVFAGYTGNPIPAALMLMAMIYIGAHISGAHYNPALSFSFFMCNRLRLEELGFYMLAQLIGALSAILFFEYAYMTLSPFLPELSPDISMMSAVSIEGVLTFVFCMTALSVCLLERYRNQAVQGFVIGLTLLAIASIGGIFNPAIAGAAFILNMVRDSSSVTVSAMTVYLIAPFIGGAIAAGLYHFLNEQRESDMR